MALEGVKKTYRLGDLKYYEIRLCILLFLSAIPNPFPMLQALVTHYTPDFHCDVSNFVDNATNEALQAGIELPVNWKEELLNLTIPWEENGNGVVQRSSCERYNLSSVRILGSYSNETFPMFNQTPTTIPCNSVQFSKGAISAVTEFGFVCGNAWKKPLYTSLYMTGNMLGAFVGGTLSDRFGRRSVFLGFTATQFIVAFITGFVTSEVAYGIAVFFSGFGALINFTAGALLGSEFVQPHLRSFTYFSLEMGYSVGYMLMAPSMYLIQDWRWFMKYTGLIGLLYIPFYWFIDETPQWLLATGQIEKAEKVLKKVAKLNKEEPRQKGELDNMMKLEIIDKREARRMCFKVAETPALLVRIIITAFSWCIISMSYYAIALNTNSLSGSRFMNVFFAGLTEVASTALFYIFVESRGRKSSCMFCMGCCGLAIAITPFVAKFSGSAVTAITMFSKLVIGIAFNIVYVYTGEMFPTTARQTSVGLSSSCARFGAIISPYLIHSGESGNTLAPSLGTAIALFTSLTLFVFLPETRKQKLPEMIEDAINLKGGLKPSCCHAKTDHEVHNTGARSVTEM